MKSNLYFYVDKWSIKIGELDKSNLNDIKKNIKYVAHLKAEDVTDRDAMFIADPFLIKENNIFYCFYEILDNLKYKGVIGYSKSLDGIVWEYGNVCLEEKWHLSYPYIFKDGQNIYMIPESAESNFVTLYKCKEFPNKWIKVKNILKGRYYDSSVIFFNNIWWLFTMQNNNMYIFYSEDLEGEWISHKKNPIIKNNNHITRAGGRIAILNNKLIRHTQDCEENYGKLVRQYEILKLTKDEYKERELGIVIENSNKNETWNKDGMHNIDINQINNEKILICSDGYYCKKVNRICNKLKKITGLKAY